MMTSPAMTDRQILAAFKHAAHAGIRAARRRHPVGPMDVTVLIHPDRWDDIVLALDDLDPDLDMRVVTVDPVPVAVPGDHPPLRVWGQPVAKDARVPRDGMIVRHELDPQPAPPRPSLGDVWRQPVPPALLTDEPLRRTYLQQVRWQARRHGYHGRVRFSALQPNETGRALLGLTTAYWIEVHP